MSRKRNLILFSAFLALASVTAVLAQAPAPTIKWSGGDMDPGDWPQWRGPNRDGVSTEKDLLDKWPEAGPPLAWKVSGLGRGLAAVVTLKGKFYIVGDHDQMSYLQCFDLASKEK